MKQILARKTTVSRFNQQIDSTRNLHGEDAEDQKHNAAGPVLATEIVYRRRKPKNNVENPRNPDELLRERARKPHISIAKNKRDSEAENEEHERVRIEAEVVTASIAC
jgi:hypothetical protein